MGELIHLRARVRLRVQPRPAHPGVRRQFIAKRQVEKAQVHATLVLGGAFLTSASMMLSLYLLAWQ